MARRAVPVLPPVVAQPSAGPARRGWLLLAHQLPATPSKLRVKTWRRLRDIGAVAVKQALYVLPDTPEAREDFEWLRVEIEGSGGEAVVFSAHLLDVEAEKALVEEFRRSRQSAYRELAAELQRVQAKGATRRGQLHPREVARYRQRFEAIERIDGFGSAGRDRAAALLAAIESKRAGASHHGATADGGDAASYRGRLWVTRPRLGVDRMSSAWLIRTFIDPTATFAFVTDDEGGDCAPVHHLSRQKLRERPPRSRA